MPTPVPTPLSVTAPTTLTPTFEDVLKALKEFTDALNAEAVLASSLKSAHATALLKETAFEDVYSAFRGSRLTPVQTGNLVERLRAHATDLETIAGIAGPARDRPGAAPITSWRKVMTVPQELTDALKKVDDDTTAVAAVVRQLRDQISTAMTADDVRAVKATLDDIAGRLEGTARDPDAPVVSGPVPSLWGPGRHGHKP